MKIAELVELGTIAYRDLPEPLAGPGEVLLRTRAVGICGTDVKAFSRGHPYFIPPCVLGHEFAGVVAQVGAGVTRFKVGDAVVAAPYIECGECALCRQGLGEICPNKSFVDGALKEFLLLPRAIVEGATFQLPPGVDFAAASLAEPLACVKNGIEKAGVAAGDTVLVIGGGPMGAMLGLMAQACAAHVLVSEISPARIAAVERLGLPVVDPSREDLVEQMQSAWERPNANKVLVAVGAKAAVEASLIWTAPGGTMLVFGGLPQPEQICIDAYKIHYQEISITGSFGYNIRQFEETAAWIATHKDRLVRIITHTVPFSEVPSGFKLAQKAEGLKVMIEFQNEEWVI